jgi:hypothetical protein
MRRRLRPAAPSLPQLQAPDNWTLGDFLATTTKQLSADLPTPGRRACRQPLNFNPRHGRSATTRSKDGAPPTAERRARIQILRTLQIIGANQIITAAEMKAYEDVFATPIPRPVLATIAVLFDRSLPAQLDGSPIGV